MSSSALSLKIEALTAEIAALLPRTNAALSGEIAFNVDQVRALSRPVTEMASILAATKRPSQDSQVTAQLQTYKAHLRELQPLLERLRVMLLAKRSQISTGQAQLNAVSHWAAALSTTQHP